MATSAKSARQLAEPGSIANTIRHLVDILSDDGIHDFDLDAADAVLAACPFSMPGEDVLRALVAEARSDDGVGCDSVDRAIAWLRAQECAWCVPGGAGNASGSHGICEHHAAILEGA